MDTIVGPSSEIVTLCNTLNGQLVPSLFATAADVTSDNLGYEQWNSGKLLQDEAYRLSGVPAFASMADIGMNFVNCEGTENCLGPEL